MLSFQQELYIYILLFYLLMCIIVLTNFNIFKETRVVRIAELFKLWRGSLVCTFVLMLLQVGNQLKMD